MTTNVMKLSKYLLLTIITLLSLSSCEKDIENVGVNLVDNNNFNTNSYTSEIVAYNENILSQRAERLGQYILGVYKDTNFGKIESSVITQLNLPSIEAVDFGINPTIDSVLIDIPYQATRNVDDYANGSPKFDLDSIIGDQSVPFKLEVFELGTYLTTLDPLNPTLLNEYYTDKVYNTGSLLYSGTFKPNNQDTVAYISRKYNLVTPAVVYDTDTVKSVQVSPSIKIPLDKNLIYSKFITSATGSELSTNDDFKQYFRGLFIKATPNGNDFSSLLSLNLAAAKMTIYYSEENIVDEASGEDLDFDGTTGETGVIIKTPKSFDFLFGSIVNNAINRDYSGSLIAPYILSPNMIAGEDKLFVQGAVGSNAVIELFKNDNLAQLQSNNWLINEANIYIYKDQNSPNLISPERLYLYNYDTNSQIKDVLSEGTIGGALAQDEDGNTLNYYKFTITDFISDVLKSDFTGTVPKLGLKVYNPTDNPISPIDTLIKNRNWNPKGVVLKGNLPITEPERIKLEIFYSELN